MRKNKIRWIGVLLCLTVLLLCAVTASAAGRIEPDHPASLQVRFRYEGDGIPDAQFYVYRVASVSPDTEFAFASAFQAYRDRISLKDNTIDSWNEMAYTLQSLVAADSVKPDFRENTGADGSFTLPSVETGLYLIIGEATPFGEYTYTPKPALVCVPMPDPATNTWNYDVSVSPKVSREKNPGGEPLRETTILKVMKVWEDTGMESERPASVTVHLYRSGVLEDTVTLSEENGWNHTWTEMPVYDELNQKIEWLVTEDAVESYKMKLERVGVTFVLTNTRDPGENPPPPGDNPPPTPPGEDPPTPPTPPTPPGDNPPSTPPGEDPFLPQTGLLWWPVPVLLCLGLISLAIGVIRRRRA